MANSFNHGLNMAYKYLSFKPRSVFEIKTYLTKKKVAKEDRIKIIDHLLKNKYLDDLEFCKLYASNRARFKPRSVFAIGYELKKKGISPSIIDTVLANYNDTDLAIQCAISRLNTWKNLDTQTLKKKVYNHLRYRGFSYDICCVTFESIKDLNP